MKGLKRLLVRILKFATGRRGSERFREEMEWHIASQTEENIRLGMLPAEARRQAFLKFGPYEAIREGYHAEGTLPFLETILQDGRYAVRKLCNSPAFTVG
jgi:hypothetical protein